MKGFLYSEEEIKTHAGWLLFGPMIDRIEKRAAELNRVVSVLDIGCGTGAVWKMHCTRDIKINYVGVDISLENLRIGKNAYGLDKVMVADIHKLPFRDNEFDFVVCYGVLQSLPDPVSAMQELHRMAKRRIVEIVETPIGVNTFSEVGVGGFEDRVSLYNQDQLMDHFENSGIDMPDKVISREAHANFNLGKPFYRNIPYRIRSIYFWN